MNNLKLIKTIKVSPIYKITFKVGRISFQNVVMIESGYGNTETIDLDTKKSVSGNVEHKKTIQQDAIKTALESEWYEAQMLEAKNLKVNA